VDESERQRVEAAFAGYAGSARLQRRWHAQNPGNVEIRREVARRIWEVAGLSLRSGPILDVGCGTGWWLEHLAGRGIPAARLHGIDLLPDRVRQAEARVSGAALHVADARELPFPDQQFGAVTLLLTLSSLANTVDVRQACDEARRVVAPGGVVVVWEPRWPNPRNPQRRTVSRRMCVARSGFEYERMSVTVLPLLARHLGPRSHRIYPLLARARPLLTHTLLVQRRDPGPTRAG
jgi:ubiquinone/menaquinone biosynthesis C-methylase UbiE